MLLGPWGLSCQCKVLGECYFAWGGGTVYQHSAGLISYDKGRRACVCVCGVCVYVCVCVREMGVLLLLRKGAGT